MKTVIKPIAVFQENQDNNFVGLKIHYYEVGHNDWYFVSVGEKEPTNFPTYGNGGQWKSKKHYPTIQSLINYHKQDNIFKIN